MPKQTTAKRVTPVSAKVTAAVRSPALAKVPTSKTGVNVKRVARPVRTSPLQAATAAIDAKYQDQGGVKGWLKKATTAVTQCPDKIGYFRHHAGGSIYYSPATGAHAVKGEIRKLWSEQGWERGRLGYPVTDEERGRNAEGEGRYTHFEGGAIYWKPDFGAIKLEGAIWLKYRDTGAEVGPLGFPKQAERGTPDRRGRFVHFEYGSIYSTPQTGACEVHGSIRGYWAKHGWERNASLGYPISDELIPDRAIGWKSPISFNVSQAILVSNAVKIAGMGNEGVGAKPLATVANKKKLTPNPVLGKRKVSASVLTAQPLVLAKPVLQLLQEANSENRFSDFENGVLFWERKTGVVRELSPWTLTSKGANLRFTGQQIASKVRGELSKSLKLPQCVLAGVAYSGVSNYDFDGAGVRNREHKFEVTYRGSILVNGKKQASDLKLRIYAAVSWNPIHRTIDLSLTRFNYVQVQSKMVGMSDARVEVGRRLDPLLWQRIVLASIPTRDGSKNVAVLSVKTMSSGLVQVYREP